MLKDLLLCCRLKRELHFSQLLLFHITKKTFRIQYMRLCQYMGKDIKLLVEDFMIVPFSLCGLKDTL